VWSNSFWQCIVTNYKPNSPPWVEQKQQVKQRNNTPKNLASYANNIQHKELCAHVWDTVQPRAQTVKLWIVIPHWEYLERTKESNQHQCAARQFSRRQGSKKIQAKYHSITQRTSPLRICFPKRMSIQLDGIFCWYSAFKIEMRYGNRRLQANENNCHGMMIGN
jgi:hypothetical protein